MKIGSFSGIILILSMAAPLCQGEEAPVHLVLARGLVKAVTPDRNTYLGGKTRIVWPNSEITDEEVLNESVCSSFCVALLREAYELDKGDLKGLFTEEWPEADEFFEGVSDGKSFEVIESIKDAEPGDFLVIDYLSNKEIPTGHVMLISGKVEKVASHKPQSLPFSYHEEATQTSLDVSSVFEWHVSIIDSSKGPHGKTDTRFQSGEDEENDDGVGEGVIRLLSDKKGVIVGYTWSTYSSSKLWLASERPCVIGRWQGK